MNSVFAVIFLIGSVQSTILAIGLGTRKNNSTANRYLTVIIALFAFNLFKLFIDESGLNRSFSALIYTDASIALLYGPLFYFYVRALTSGRKFTRQDLLHFIPFVVHLLIILPIYFLDSEAKIRAWDSYISGGFTHKYQPLLTYGLKIIQYSSYLALCINMISKYRNDIEDHLSTTYKTDLSWLRNLFVINLGFLGFLFIALILHAANFFTMGHSFSRTTYLWDLVIISTLSILAFRQSPVFKVPEEITGETPEETKEEEKEKYGTSRLEQDTLDSIAKELLEFVEKEKPYLDPELSVSSLGEMISVQRHVLSQVINSTQNKNFYNFINAYRVEEVKKLLKNPVNSDKNILEIAFLAGFRSKSHFNLIFKNITGLTPKEFRRNN